MNLRAAQELSKKVRRSSKFNRKLAVVGILVNRRGAHIQCVSKEDGRPFHFGYEHRSPRNDLLTEKEIKNLMEGEDYLTSLTTPAHSS
jgi:hypothetical protein